jgi:hypothetical protein
MRSTFVLGVKPRRKRRYWGDESKVIEWVWGSDLLEGLERAP